MDASVDLLDEDSDSELEEDLMILSAISISSTMVWYGSQFIKTPHHIPYICALSRYSLMSCSVGKMSAFTRTLGRTNSS